MATKAETKNEWIIGVGRRKESMAIVKIKEGKGSLQINKRDIKNYFPLFYQREEAVKPLVIAELTDKFDIDIKVEGGGSHGQVDAVKLGIARALLKYDENLSGKLRELELLTRDPRMKERKKYGQKGSRKKFQWTKR
jgi:small subunit ribosomal protein S9